jgi:hypothetical protein
LSALEVGLQVGPQQRLHAVQGSSRVHRCDHGRLAFETIEQVGGVLPTCQAGSQVPRDEVADARGAQEVADLGRQAREDLAHEILGYRALIAREGREEGAEVVLRREIAASRRAAAHPPVKACSAETWVIGPFDVTSYPKRSSRPSLSAAGQQCSAKLVTLADEAAIRRSVPA